MTVLPTIIMILTIAMSAVMVPRIYHSWLMAKELSRTGAMDQLCELLEEENGWIKRHFGCGMAGLLLVWLMSSCQIPHLPKSLVDGVALYVTLSLLFAIVESVLAQRIEASMAAILAPVKLRRRK